MDFILKMEYVNNVLLTVNNVIHLLPVLNVQQAFILMIINNVYHVSLNADSALVNLVVHNVFLDMDFSKVFVFHVITNLLHVLNVNKSKIN